MDRFRTVAPVIREHLSSPYEYGRADCFAMGMAVAQALTSIDHGKPYRGRYKTKTGAGRLMRRLGHESLSAVLLGHFPATAPAQARIGDLAVVVTEEGEHVAVCLGAVFTVKTERGRRDFAVGDCKAAFRVG